MSYYCNAAGQRFPLPERMGEPPDAWARWEGNCPDREELEVAFARENMEQFFTFVMELDPTIATDFACSNRLDFQEFCEEARG